MVSKQNELAKRMKENKDAIRKAEKEMEEVKATYTNKKRAFNRIQNAKQQAMDEKKAARESRSRKIQNRRLKFARKRLNSMNAGMRGVKGKYEDSGAALKRAQSRVDDAAKLCKSLKAKGEHVPDDHRDDFSSPHAWKPPGYEASKQLGQAKEALAKAKAVHDKASSEFGAKDAKKKAALARLTSFSAGKKAS